MNEQSTTPNVVIILMEGAVAACLADSWLTATVLAGGAGLLYLASRRNC